MFAKEVRTRRVWLHTRCGCQSANGELTSLQGARERAPFRGTTRYCSIAAHDHKEQVSRDA